ncbi:MAG: SDR family NAD(P)-dependent oxidoreductase, partial [Solirubrobacteraceae bacterium]
MTSHDSSPVWLITGSSSGFGRHIAQAALARGDRVVATARRPEAIDDLVAAAPDRVHAVALDVTDGGQV